MDLYISLGLCNDKLISLDATSAVTLYIQHSKQWSTHAGAVIVDHTKLMLQKNLSIHIIYIPKIIECVCVCVSLANYCQAGPFGKEYFTIDAGFISLE